MKHVSRIVAVILLMLTAGCGGGGEQASPFVGSWSGHWVATYAPTRPEDITLTVEPTGRATGVLSRPNEFPKGSLYGTVSPSGQVDLTIGGINPPPVPPRATGKLYTNMSGGIFGSLLVTDNGAPSFAVVIDLERQ